MRTKKILTFLFLSCCAALFSGKAMADGVNLPEVGLPNPSGGLPAVVEGLVKWLLGIFGFLAILSFIISGFMYFMGGSMSGEKKEVSRAKNQMKWSIVGVIVGLMGYIILYAIDSALKGNGLG